MANAAALTFLFFACYTVAAPSYTESAQVTLLGNSNELQVGWYDPRDNGGRFLDVCLVLSSSFYAQDPFFLQYTTETNGEPLNVIISGSSDPFILTDHGFEYYTKYVKFCAQSLVTHSLKVSGLLQGMSRSSHGRPPWSRPG